MQNSNAAQISSICFLYLLSLTPYFGLSELSFDSRDKAAQAPFQNLIMRALFHGCYGYRFADRTRDNNKWYIEHRGAE